MGVDIMDGQMSNAVHGSHLAEVFTIKIDKISNGTNKCEVYGTIQVQDEEGTFYLYNRCLENAEFVCENGTLLSLIAKERPIYASSSFELLFDLKDNNGNEFINSSCRVDLKDIDYTPFKEKCRIANVEGKMGVAIVNFAVFQVGVMASFIFKFDKKRISGDNNYVHGNLVIHYDKLEAKEDIDTRIVIFEKTAENAVQLSNGFKIPLARDFVVVPGYGSIKIEGEIHFLHPDGSMELIKICEESKAQSRGSKRINYEGKYGGMVFTFAWSNIFKFYDYRDYVIRDP